MSDHLTSYGAGPPEKRRRTAGSLAATAIAVAVTGLLLWMGLSWAVGLIASAVRLTLMTLAIAGVVILLLWIVRRGMGRR